MQFIKKKVCTEGSNKNKFHINTRKYDLTNLRKLFGTSGGAYVFLFII